MTETESEHEVSENNTVEEVVSSVCQVFVDVEAWYSSPCFSPTPALPKVSLARIARLPRTSFGIHPAASQFLSAKMADFRTLYLNCQGYNSS